MPSANIPESSPVSKVGSVPISESPVSGTEQEALRADARENRQRILRVAHDMLAVSSDASLNSIAKAAGVGPGTLYRHFPTREDLVLAVYRHDVQQLADSVPELLEEYPPLDAFRHWFERLASYVRIKHGLGDALGPAVRENVVRAPTNRSSPPSASCCKLAWKPARSGPVWTRTTFCSSWAPCGESHRVKTRKRKHTEYST